MFFLLNVSVFVGFVNRSATGRDLAWVQFWRRSNRRGTVPSDTARRRRCARQPSASANILRYSSTASPTSTPHVFIGDRWDEVRRYPHWNRLTGMETYVRYGRRSK